MNREDKRDQRVRINVSERLDAAIKEAAKQDHRSKSNWVVFALRTMMTRARGGREVYRLEQTKEKRLVPLTIRIPLSMKAELTRVAEGEGRPVSQWAALALDLVLAGR